MVCRVCGVVIVVSLALLVLVEVVKPPAGWHAIFWLETVATRAFWASWLVRGGFLGILADR